jgi:hypothetical protein
MADTAVGKGVQQEANMSLDNTSLPGRPALDEPVPSRYALRVGDIDVMVVSDGVLSLPGAMLGHNADTAVRAAWLNDMFLPPDVLEWALNVVVVRSGSRTILVDAGLGADPDRLFAPGYRAAPASNEFLSFGKRQPQPGIDQELRHLAAAPIDQLAQMRLEAFQTAVFRLPAVAGRPNHELDERTIPGRPFARFRFRH